MGRLVATYGDPNINVWWICSEWLQKVAVDNGVFKKERRCHIWWKRVVYRVENGWVSMEGWHP